MNRFPFPLLASPNLRRGVFQPVLLVGVACWFAGCATPPPATPPPLPPVAVAPTQPVATFWPLDRSEKIGGLAVNVLGHPEVIHEGKTTAVVFDGAHDGLILPVTAIGGLQQFTIELLIRPAADGPAEQRFFHTQDSEGNRSLLEIRLTPAGWALDTFLFTVGKTGLPLLDRALLHSSNEWHWVALRFDGHRMTSFVDGVQELTGEVEFSPMLPTGQTSIGVRLNQVYWFKGAIREVRIHPTALATPKLSH